MYSPLSENWDSAIRSSGRRKTVIDFYAFPSLPIATLEAVDTTQFSIRADRRSANRRTASVVMTDAEVLGLIKDFEASLNAYGSEIRIRTGVIHDDGEEELIPLGVFQIEDIQWGEDETSFSMDLVDRSKIFQRASFLFPYSPAGLTAKTVLQNLVSELTDWLTVDIDTSLHDVTLPGGVTYQGDYLSALHDLATTIGGEFYFDVHGNPKVVPTPFVDPELPINVANWLVNAGEQGVLISTSRSISRVDTYNEVIVLGAGNEGGQPFYVARDDDPNSGTYYDGPFGRSTLRIDRQELTTDSQCQVVAEAELNDSRGLSRSLSLQSLANPALQEGDIIAVSFPNGDTELHLVDQMSMNESWSCSIDTRVQRQAA